jgi:Uma2 family endonuclease
MATALKSPANGAVVLYDADWQTYERLLKVFAERPKVRLTYDRGVLEIMSPLKEHELDRYLLGRFVDALTEELGLPIQGGGSTTLRRRRKQKGLEPDNCYWIVSEPLVRGKRDLNLRRDPPPDLAIEVDATRSSLNRMDIYAKLRVPEVWRLDGTALLFYGLGSDGKFTPMTHSRAFPMVAPADLNRFLALSATQDANSIIRQFREWLRQQIAGKSTPPCP